LFDLIDSVIRDSALPMNRFIALGLCGTEDWKLLRALQERYMLHCAVVDAENAVRAALCVYAEFLETGEAYIGL
jgi:hypothetical protein